MGCMRTKVLVGVGALLVLLGAVWTLQGLGVLGGSAMTGEPLWAVVGPLVALAGAVLAWRSLRRQP